MTEQEFLQSVLGICEEHGAEKVVLFGSRARGTASDRSDFDFAVYGSTRVDAIVEAIDDLPTLYSADVVDMTSCDNQLLIREIEDHGIRL